MKNVLDDLNSTEKSRGRASDEKRAARNSIVMSIVDTPENETEEEEEPKPRPKGRALKLIGLPRTTGARIWNNVAEKRYLIRTGQALGDFRMITKRDGFYTKIPPAGRLAIQKWVRNYHLVVYSPNNKDSLKVKVVDEVNGGFKTVLKNKLILTCSVRELFNDLYKPGTGLVGPDVEFSVIDSGGNRLVSDTVFRTLLPQELRPANQIQKGSCCYYLYVL